MKNGFNFKEDDNDYSFDEFQENFFDNFFGYDNWIVSLLIVIIIKFIFVLLSPAILIVVLSLSWYLYLSAKIDKLNGIMLTCLL